MNFLRFVFTRLFLRHLLLAVGITAVLLWLTLQGLAWYTKHNDYIIVPDYKGQVLAGVVENAENRYYRFTVIDSLFDADRQPGTILTQDPYAGSKVKRDRMIYLTITSTVPEKTIMPELRDLTLRQAQTMLRSAGLKTGRLSYIRSFDADAVQNQLYKGRAIKAGTEIDKGTVIDLVVGMGSQGTEEEEEKPEQDSVW